MIREQTDHLQRWSDLRHWVASTTRWFALVLLMLAVVLHSTPNVLIAQEASETSKEQTDANKVDTEFAEESEKKEDQPAQESNADAKSETGESSSTESGDGKSEAKKDSDTSTANTAEAKEPDAQADKKKEQPKQEKSDEKKKGSESTKEEAKAMKAEDSTNKPSSSTEAKPAAKVQPSVEEERPEEVDPPKPKAKQDEPPKKDPPKKKKCVIGATATLLEKQSGLKFRARVDTGAKSCSLHVENITIENESKKEHIIESMTENIGKVVTFEIKNGEGKPRILKRKIANYVIIKNSTNGNGKRRYKVPMTFLWKNMEKEVLVTLTDRSHMAYPLLLGRNFLQGDFLVDVEIDSDD